MKRFLVKNGAEPTLRLYYKDLETARECWPGANISEDADYSYLKYIDLIKDNSEFLGYDCKGHEVYRADLQFGELKIKFCSDNGVYYGYCEDQFIPNSKLSPTITWRMCDPQGVWMTYFKPLKFEEISFCCKSRGGKIQKPKELSGVKPALSVSYGKVKCPIFVKGNDLYINHHDYFSPSLKLKPEDIGAPLDVIVPKYCGKEKSKKFIYGDAWGDIVLQNVAWLKFENAIPWIKIRWQDAAIWMRDEVFRHNGFKNTEGAYMDWLRFLENVCIKLENII